MSDSAGCRRNFVAWGLTPRPGSLAASVTLGHHHNSFGSARITRCPHGIDLVGACPRILGARSTRGGSANKGSPRMGDRYTTSPGSVFRGARGA